MDSMAMVVTDCWSLEHKEVMCEMDLQGAFKFKREFVPKKFIHNEMEKSYTQLFKVVPIDCHTLVPTFWKLLNSSFKEGFRLLVYPTLHKCNDFIIIPNLLPPKIPFIGPNK
jgi:hypothetical protein